MSAMINPDLVSVKQQLDAQGKEIAELRGSVTQMEKYLISVNRQSTLQIAAIVISLCLTMAGGLYYQTTAMDRRIEQMERRFDERISGVEKRLERVERNLDELNKELRTKREVK